jgi:hypothetical protein
LFASVTGGIPAIVSIFFGGSVDDGVGVVVAADVDVFPELLVVVDCDCGPSPPLHATATKPTIVAATIRRRAHRRSVLASKRRTLRGATRRRVPRLPCETHRMQATLAVRTRVVALAGSLVAAALAVTPGAWAASSDPVEEERTWTQVTDAEQRNIDEVSVARTGDGVLHALWHTRAGANLDEIRDTPVDTDGTVGDSATVSAGWPSAGNPAVIVMPDGGLRVFFPGLTLSSGTGSGMQSASSDSKGTTWTEQGGPVSSSSSAMPDGTGAALRQDGTPAFAYAYSFVLGLHFGLNPADPDTDLISGNGCCAYLPNLAFSETDDDGYIAWYSNVDDQTGLWVQPIWPTLGTAIAVPKSASDGKAIGPTQRTPLSARTGASGTYIAYCSGYPTCTEVLLWQIGEDAPITVAKGTDIEDVNVAADPDGRLWVMWEDTAESSLFALRTDEDVSELGAIVPFDEAPDTDTVWKLQGAATSDSLDVFASFTTPDSLATWHTQVLPGLTVETKKTKKNVTFTVSDAGEPIKGAKVAFKKKTVSTNAKGQATAPVGKGTATVTMSGYTAATALVK